MRRRRPPREPSLFILEEPYVSDYLRDTATESRLPVLDTPLARRLLAGRPAQLLSPDAFARALRRPGARLYTNSENALGWVSKEMGGSELARRVALFKDKVRFRELLADLYPDYRFQGIPLDRLRSFDAASLSAPFVVKPAVGFFSLGVHVVERAEDWPEVVTRIEEEVGDQARMYPDEVLDLGRYVAEEVIPGDEYAVDAYFDGRGEAVIVNILAHPFSGTEDVSDRVYFTSPAVIRRWKDPFAAYLSRIGRRGGLIDFPVHAELRVTEDGRIAPIEINPLRFAGWCTTDIARHAYGLNPYLSYLQDRPPQWPRLLADHDGSTVAMVIADLPAGVDGESVASIDYEGFAARFSAPLELRRVDWARYRVFAFLFFRVASESADELGEVLHADFRRYLRLKAG